MKDNLNVSGTYHVIGTMSGSSLDGMDIAYCKIKGGPEYSYQIIKAETFPYSEGNIKFLKSIAANKNKKYDQENKYFAKLTALKINTFINKHTIHELDFIAAHGHTIFHFPEQGITCQIGDGVLIAELVKKDVLFNFRQADIEAGGQGAPLVPICDELFFSDFNACLNIGGIANISFLEKDKRVGFDICAANQLLNFCAQELNLDFDEDGRVASSGKINVILLEELNNCEFFQRPFPKSMDNNFIKENLIPLLRESDISAEDKLATASEHIAQQISSIIVEHILSQQIIETEYNLLVTGGGAFNKHLIKRIEAISGINIELPSSELIQFKEALAMALMGVLRWQEKPNFLPSVTGARHAVSGGEIARKPVPLQ